MTYYTFYSAALALGVSAAMVCLLEAGRRIGQRRIARDPEGARAGVGAVDGAVFALLGLLLAFTFSGAASRFDQRRQLIVEEANAIGTAYLRLDVLPPDVAPKLREQFRQYLDARLAVYRKLPDVTAAMEEMVTVAKLQGEIWRDAVAAAGRAGGPAPMLILPALNAMIDITTTRTMATEMHPPAAIFAMLIILALAAALLAGYGMAGSGTRSWLHMIAFALVMGLAIYIILDIEYPRLGLIRVDAFDQVLVNLRESMR